MLVAFTPDGLRVVHHFTADSTRLVAALRTVSQKLTSRETDDSAISARLVRQDAITVSTNRSREGPDANEVDQITALLTAIPRYAAISRDQDNTMETLYQMQQLARALAGVPGRKSLVWVTGGLTFYEYLPDTMAVPDKRNIAVSMSERASRAYHANAQIERTWAMLNDASIAVYPIDVTEVTVPSFTEAMYQLPHHTGSALLRSQAMLGFTENTGGSYCQLNATLENCFRDAARDSSGYFLLSFYVDSQAKPGWHKLKVKVSASDIRVRSRGGYFQENADSLHAAANGMQQVLASPLDSTGILLAARWITPPSNHGGKASFELFVDPNSISFDGSTGNHLRLSIAIASSDGGLGFKGQYAKVFESNLSPDQRKKILSEGIVYKDSVDVAKGTRAFRFVVRDESNGRVGTLTTQ